MGAHPLPRLLHLYLNRLLLVLEWHKMRWQWHKNSVKAEKVYCPVPSNDIRPFEAKWADREYLENVRAFQGNTIFIDLVARALSNARDQADRAQSPDELKGYVACIKEIKWLLTAPFQAKDVIDQLKQIEKTSKEDGGNSLG
jgi:hypothetical protein